jgi:hypothetical protein
MKARGKAACTRKMFDGLKSLHEFAEQLFESLSKETMELEGNGNVVE